MGKLRPKKGKVPEAVSDKAPCVPPQGFSNTLENAMTSRSPSRHALLVPPLTLPLACLGRLKNPGRSYSSAPLFLLKRDSIFPGVMSRC